MGISPDLPGIHAEFAAVGVPFEKRVGRVLECMRLCRALWTGEAISWDGRWQLKNAMIGPVPHRKGGPPIWMGGNTRGAMERAARYFDGWFPISPTPEIFRQQWEEARAMRREGGRDPDAFDGAMYLTVCVDDDVARAESAHWRVFGSLLSRSRRNNEKDTGMVRWSGLRRCRPPRSLCRCWPNPFCDPFHRRPRTPAGGDRWHPFGIGLVTGAGWCTSKCREIEADREWRHGFRCPPSYAWFKPSASDV